MVSYFVICAVGLVLLVADQVVKVIIDTNFAVATDEIVVIKNFFSITNVHNTGAAWGIFNNATVVLTVVSILMALLLIFVFTQADSNLFKLAVALLIVGAIGNVIDRIRLGYVVDFLHFYNLFGFYDFPTFNIADICVTSGVIGLLIYIIFVSTKKKAFRLNTPLYTFFYGKKNVDPEEAEAGDGIDQGNDSPEITDSQEKQETED